MPWRDSQDEIQELRERIAALEATLAAIAAFVRMPAEQLERMSEMFADKAQELDGEGDYDAGT